MSCLSAQHLGVGAIERGAPVTLVIVGLIVLGSILFVVYTLVALFGQASPLRLQTEETKVATEEKRKRLEDHKNGIETLRESKPELERRILRLEKWVELLTRQKSSIEASAQNTQKTELEQRTAEVRDGRPEGS